jgi:hypothetical protein
MLSVFIVIRMAPLKLRTILSNVVTVLTCTSCSVQAANAMFMVSLVRFYVARKDIVLIWCVCIFYVQNCWMIFDEHFY